MRNLFQTLALTNIARIECRLGGFWATIFRPSNEAGVRRALRSWGSPAFKGAKLSVIDHDGKETPVGYIFLAELYELKHIARRHEVEAALALAERPPVVVAPLLYLVPPPSAQPAKIPATTSRTRVRWDRRFYSAT
jgi:hypothetical protein